MIQLRSTLYKYTEGDLTIDTIDTSRTLDDQFAVGIPVSLAIGDKPINEIKKDGELLYSNYNLENSLVNIFKGMPYYYTNEDFTTSNATSVPTGAITIQKSSSSPKAVSKSTTSTKWVDASTLNPLVSSFEWKRLISPLDYTRYYRLSSSESIRLNYCPVFFHLNEGVSEFYKLPSYGEWPSPVMLPTPNSTEVWISEDQTKLTTSSTDKKVISTENNDMTFVYNLIPQRTYYWRTVNGSTLGAIQSFTTEGLIRMLRVPRVRNVRDLGGWKVTDAMAGTNHDQTKTGHIKYEKLYRGGHNVDTYGAISSLAANATKLSTDDAKKVQESNAILRELGVDCHLDIDVEYLDVPIASGTTTTNADVAKEDGTKPTLTEVAVTSYADYFGFSASSAASWSGMPDSFSGTTTALKAIKLTIDWMHNRLVTNNKSCVYFHCRTGADRTGCLAFLIETLCGANVLDAVRDYEMTTFNSMCTSRIINRTMYNSDKGGFYIYDGSSSNGTPETKGAYTVGQAIQTLIKNLSGTTLQQKVFNFLTNTCKIDSTKVLELKDALIDYDA